MGKVAFLFPGQGSQVVGMGKDAAEHSPNSRHIYEQADQALGFSLSSLCFEGPEDQLTRTENTQPAILTTSIALLHELQNRLEIKPDFVAGHSLGEYSALVAAGALSFENAVTTVRYRGKFMEEAVPTGQGAMAAVMGVDREVLQQVCETVSEQGDSVQLANLNSPGQIVISGSAEGVRKASEEVKNRGARRVIPLKVSGPFHSRLMEPAAAKLKDILAQMDFSDAEIPVVSNVTAQSVQQKEEIVDLLIRQVFSPVLWEDSVRYMLDQGVDTFIEIGPGNVLSGLVKKVERQVKTFNIQDLETMKQFLQEWKE